MSDSEGIYLVITHDIAQNRYCSSISIREASVLQKPTNLSGISDSNLDKRSVTYPIRSDAAIKLIGLLKVQAERDGIVVSDNRNLAFLKQ